MDILLSVIVPVFNCEKYIKRCLNNLVNLEEGCEIIIVDDGSSDRTGTICDKYVGNNIFVYHKKNGGVGSARNYGISKARGKYLTFIDGDDTIKTDMLNKVMILLADSDYRMVMFNHFYDETQLASNIFLDNKYDNLVEKKSIMEWLYTQKIPISTVWSNIFVTDIIRKKHLYFNENMKISEDILFICSYLDYIENIYISSLTYYIHFDNSDSACNNAQLIYLENLSFMLKELYKTAEQYGQLNEYKDKISNVCLGQMIRCCAKLFRAGMEKHAVYRKIQEIGFKEEICNMKYIDFKHRMCGMLLLLKCTYMIKKFIY